MTVELHEVLVVEEVLEKGVMVMLWLFGLVMVDGGW